MKFSPDIVQTRWVSPLGPMIVAATPRGLAGLWFEGQRHLPAPELMAAWPQQPEHPVLRQAAQQLGDYFAGRRVTFDLPLDL